MMSDPEARINADGIFSIVFSEGQLHRAGFFERGESITLEWGDPFCFVKVWSASSCRLRLPFLSCSSRTPARYLPGTR
jgi:hypothetical protein